MKLCIVAGEASGDLHAAELVRELRKRDPDLKLFGLGGDLLAAQGMRVLHHASELGIVGLFNVLKHLGMFRRIFRELLVEIERERPDAVILVDYPEFNLRLAKECKRRGVKVIYYISPQIWAWRRGRVKHIAKYVDQMIVILPFEEAFYTGHDVATTYVGHPVVEQLEGLRSPDALPAPGEPLKVALLPGSRKMEVAALLPAMLDAAEILGRSRKIDAYLIQAPTIDRGMLDEHLDGRIPVRVVAHEGGEQLAQAHLAISSSGTATLEAAVIGVPVVVLYRLSPATYQLARILVRLPDFSLVNIVAGKRIVPELIQSEVRGELIAEAAESLLQPESYPVIKRELARVRSLLGESGSSAKAADRVWSLLNP